MDIDERVDAIEKKLEGNTLALSATAETLETMNSYLGRLIQKQEADEEKKEEELKEQEEEEKEEKMVKNLIKALEITYPNLFKEAGPDVPAEMTNTGADSEEGSEKVDTKPEESQKPIDDGNVTDKVEKQEDEKEEEKVEKEGSDEEKEKQEEEKEEDKEDMENMIQKAVEERLRKAGFKESKGLNSPTSRDLGTGDMPILKGDESESETVEKMKDLSYKELRRMQEKMNQDSNTQMPGGVWNFD